MERIPKPRKQSRSYNGRESTCTRAAEVERAKNVIEGTRPVNLTVHAAEMAGTAV
jgi:hypothetical protein